MPGDVSGIDPADVTVRQAWDLVAYEWATDGIGSVAVWTAAATVVTVVTAVLAAGVMAALMLRALARNVSERADARPVALRTDVVFEVGAAAPPGVRGDRGAVYAPGHGDVTVILRPGESGPPEPPQRWHPDNTIEFRHQP